MTKRLIIYAAILAASLLSVSSASGWTTEPCTGGTSGPDVYVGDGDNNCKSLSSGNDTAFGDGNGPGIGHDKLFMGGDADDADGDRGNSCEGVQDVIEGAGGSDILRGNGGDDVLTAGGHTGTAPDELRGQCGDDTLEAADGDWTVVVGGDGYNVCYLDRNLDQYSGCDEKHFG